ncbi:MAG: SET domain-containing protein, partial [Methanosarcinaceae archaeon]|nr:SET domain-containing protein [Methanosarcinaceae archaeon]
MQSICVKDAPGKGKGIFAQKHFKKDELIEICPVVVFPPEEVDTLEHTKLYNYYFAWGSDSREAAIALGYGSLYNHSYTPNAKYEKDFSEGLLKYVCIREIQQNEEITINYNHDPEDKTPVW